jgi:hypothetical protein
MVLIPISDISHFSSVFIDIVCETMGGDVPMIPVSSVTKEGFDELREAIALVGEMAEPSAPFQGPARAVVRQPNLTSEPI